MLNINPQSQANHKSQRALNIGFRGALPSYKDGRVSPTQPSCILLHRFSDLADGVRAVAFAPRFLAHA
jgi:hypothetical protein